MNDKMRSTLLLVRRGDWLTEDRARAYGSLIAAVSLIALVVFYRGIIGAAWHGPGGRPLASDFDAFWSGARLALNGNAAGAYDAVALHAMESATAQLPIGQFFIYLYPPTFLLMSLPLGALPYLAALAIFITAFFATWALCILRLLPAPGWAVLPILAFPVGVLNAVIGQNGYASASCFGAAMILIESRPALAGASLGLLVCKPHLAIAVPLALLAARRWVSLLSCTITALCLAAVSQAVLGTETWQHFLANSANAPRMLDSSEIWPKLVSVYAGLRLLHGNAGISYSLQVVAGVAALAGVAVLSRSRPGPVIEIAAAIPAAMLCTPYVWDYDLVCLSLPMAWLTSCGLREGWRDWEKTLLAALYITTPVARFLGSGARVQVMPLLVAALLGLIVSRGLTAGRAG